MMLAGLVGIFVHALMYSALIEDPYTWLLAAGITVVVATARSNGLRGPGTAEAP